MTTHLDDTQGLDSILARNPALIVGTYKGEPILTPQAAELKQAILHWVAMEVIGNTPIYDITDASPEFIAGYNSMAEATRIMLLGQRQTLIHHGYKQNTKETGSE
jgi:hypothetical protein